jgi:S-adenosylmethionine hydrolase
VFAPVAAWISKGVRLDSLGEVIEDYALLDLPAPAVEGEQVNGEVIYSDSFGNAITNITSAEIDKVRESKPDGKLRILLKGGQTDVKDYFEQGNDKRPHGLINSSGNLEIFYYMGNATAMLKLKPGDQVSLKVG